MAIRIDTDAGLAQFENTNELRMYPFADGASLIDANGKELSRDIIVDLHMFVSADVAVEVKLVSVHISQSMISACFKSVSDYGTGAMSVIVSKGSFKPYSPYRLEKLSGSNDIGGIVTFGDITFPGNPCTYFLNTDIHPCCIISSKPAGLRSIKDPKSGQSLSGDIVIEFSDYIEAIKNGNVFSLSLEDGTEDELTSNSCNAFSGEQCGATPIRTINGVSPDADGNIVLWFH